MATIDVMPAEAGIQKAFILPMQIFWTPASARVTKYFLGYLLGDMVRHLGQ